MNMEFNKKYNPLEFEDEIYSFWINSKEYEANIESKDKIYTIVMPPPNITGKLHMGHALDSTLQDILIRFKRMNGYNVLWVPGVDHAAIATEAKLVEKLKKMGKTKEQIGRKAFLKMALSWKEEYQNNIENQQKKLGISCDWNRKRYTMDSSYKKAVVEFFSRLYKDGLIYKGKKIINWCYSCKTTISDAEVEHKERKGNLYYIKYKLKDEQGYIEIATTRPETIFADVAVAVNPKDERYRKYIGKNLILPLSERVVPIIEDSYVGVDFGTGAVKITPAHDPNDFEVGRRHNLENIELFDEDGNINSVGGSFCGVPISLAREKVVEELKKEGLLLKVVPIIHSVGHCYRCGGVIEPILSSQWFVKMKELARPAVGAVKNGEIEFIPKRFEKIYFNWMENVEDWCISRQLWWGHRIPLYYCKDCGYTGICDDFSYVCESCNGKNIFLEEDTLDTWFSAGLWPYAVFYWPNEESKDYKLFYPTDVLVTGYDIIFFWVARMIFSGIYTTKKVPFKKVLIHGLIRGEDGRKMSKSLGNGVDPIEIINSYGADALRFSLANGVNAGNDLRFKEEKIIASRNFANKLWNAARFVFINLKENNIKLDEFYIDLYKLSLEDKWFISKLNSLIKEVSNNIDSFEFSVACQKLHYFIWEVFCDWYIELYKIKKEKDIYFLKFLVYLLDVLIRLLHPFMPFVTQYIYFGIHGEEKIIGKGSWPKVIENIDFLKEEEDFENVIELVRAIRNFRATKNIAKNIKTKIFIETKEIKLLKECKNIIEKLGFAKEVEISNKFEIDEFKSYHEIITNKARVFIFLPQKDSVLDVDSLKKEKMFLENEVSIFEKKLSNENFIRRAPKEVVEKTKEKLNSKKEKLKKVLQSLKNI